MKGLKEKTKINPKQVITIFNILRSIGLNTSHRGTKYINKAVFDKLKVDQNFN